MTFDEKPWWYFTSPVRSVSGTDALELVEEIARILAENVDKDVQPATVGHADDGLDTAVGAEPLQGLVEHGNQALAALETKALGSGKARMQVLLQSFRRAQPVEDGEPRLRRVFGSRVHGFQALPHPELLRRIGDVRVFGTERAAIGLRQCRDDLPQRRLAAALGLQRTALPAVPPRLEELRRSGPEHRVEIGVREMVVGEIQLRRRRAFPQVQGVELSLAVAEFAVRVDQLPDTDLLEFVLRGNLGADAFRPCAKTIAPEPLEVAHDGTVRHVAGDTLDHRQLLEVTPPLLRNAVRILEIGFVEGLDVGVAGGKLGVRPHAFNEGVGQGSAPLSSQSRPRPPALQMPCCNSIVRILPIARVGFSPLGQTLTQFMMPRQRKTLNGSSSAASRSALAVSRLSARNR